MCCNNSSMQNWPAQGLTLTLLALQWIMGFVVCKTFRKCPAPNHSHGFASSHFFKTKYAQHRTKMQSTNSYIDYYSHQNVRNSARSFWNNCLNSGGPLFVKCVVCQNNYAHGSRLVIFAVCRKSYDSFIRFRVTLLVQSQDCPGPSGATLNSMGKYITRILVLSFHDKTTKKSKHN